MSIITDIDGADKIRGGSDETLIGNIGDRLKVDTSVPSLLNGIIHDDIQVSYPTSTTEQYAYYLSAVLQATIEITYSNSSKLVLTRARRI